MKHIFLLKTPEFIPVIHEVMKGYDYVIRVSQYSHHVDKIIREYKEPARFYSIGGDGFFNQVIQNLVNTEHEVVIIPKGTGNDFSRSVNQSSDPKQVLIDSLNKESILIDTVSVNGIYAVNSICFSLDALIANSIHEHSDKTKNSNRYVLSVFTKIRHYPFYHVKIIENEKVIYDDQTTLCTFMNGQYYGGGIQIAPKASLQDGLLNVFIIPKILKRNVPFYAAKILTHHMNKIKDSLSFKTKEVYVYTKICNIDGEEIEASSYHLKVNPHSLRVIQTKK
ncbi:MAG: diacylglycerol/lipid kinase family protein [Eggerthia catenaformis]|uniref:diacylglycerol/lipid kinase family protein n=1 Tax=Eggerthia catenaformis TaxID=31973 RepID=UPI003F9ED8A1